MVQRVNRGVVSLLFVLHCFLTPAATSPSCLRHRAGGGSDSCSASATDVFVGDGSSCVSALMARQYPSPRAGSCGSASPLLGLENEIAGNTSLVAVNVALGDTGSRYFHGVMCKAGIAALHGGLACHVSRATVRAHYKVLRLVYIHIVQCMDRRDAGQSTWTNCTYGWWLPRVKDSLRTVLTSGVQVLTDTPYPSVLPELMAIAPGAVVAHNLRGVEKWATRRAENSHIDLWCKPSGGRPQSIYLLPCIVGLAPHQDITLNLMRTSTKVLGDSSRFQAMKDSYILHNDCVASLACRHSPSYWQFCLWDREGPCAGEQAMASFSKHLGLGAAARRHQS